MVSLINKIYIYILDDLEVKTFKDRIFLKIRIKSMFKSVFELFKSIIFVGGLYSSTY